MKKIKWVNDKYGSTSRAKVLNGAMYLICHYDMLTKSEENPTHSYSIWVGKIKVGLCTDSTAGQKFAEKKFIELIKESI